MQAIIFGELKKYAEARLGADAWRPLLRAAGVTRPVYAPGHDYPDAEAGAIVAAASKKTGLEPDAILQDFGEFIAPDLVRLYRHLIHPSWRSLDLLEHTEETIHKAVRRDNPSAHPPQLKCTRTSSHEVVVRYSSERRMCGVAKGIIRGLGRQFGDRLSLTEPTCMLKGGAECQIVVKRLR
jgi:Haem-NO-binding